MLVLIHSCPSMCVSSCCDEHNIPVSPLDRSAHCSEIARKDELERPLCVRITAVHPFFVSSPTPYRLYAANSLMTN